MSAVAQTLYIYKHCPFCVRVLMAKNFLKKKIDVKVFANDDEAGPIKLVGKKMVPILEFDGKAQGESLDIVNILNNDTPVEAQLLPKAAVHAEVEAALGKLNPFAAYLIMPRFVKFSQFDEFATQSSKNYFINKKSGMMGKSFEEMESLAPTALAEVEKTLESFPKLPLPSENGQKLSFTDIVVFPPLRNLTLVKGIKFPEHLSKYLQEVSELSELPLYTKDAL